MLYSDDKTIDEVTIKATSQDDMLPMPGWARISVITFILFVAAYLFIARPANQRLIALRRQVFELQETIELVAASRNDVQNTNDLLGLLAAQDRQRLAAEQSLAEIRRLHADLIEEATAMQDTLSAIQSLADLKETVRASGQQTEDAVAAWGAVTNLHEQLTSAAPLTAEAQRASDELLALESKLICRSGSFDQAEATLDGLFALQDRLEIDEAQLNLALSRADQLLTMKDTVLAQTGNLADAVETLELTSDLQQQFTDVAKSFAEMRHNLVEIQMLEPTVNRAVAALRPITELANLRRLNPDDLRQLVRQIHERHRQQTSQLAEDNHTTSDAVQVLPTSATNEKSE